MEPLLTKLKHSFSEWRASTTNRHPPESLRAQAVKCLDKHSFQEISSAIAMSVNSIRGWKKAFSREKEAIANLPEFVAMNLAVDQEIGIANQTSPSLQINLPSGITIQVSPASMIETAALIVSLHKESRTCSI